MRILNVLVWFCLGVLQFNDGNRTDIIIGGIFTGTTELYRIENAAKFALDEINESEELLTDYRLILQPGILFDSVSNEYIYFKIIIMVS